MIVVLSAGDYVMVRVWTCDIIVWSGGGDVHGLSVPLCMAPNFVRERGKQLSRFE